MSTEVSRAWGLPLPPLSDSYDWSPDRIEAWSADTSRALLLD